MSNPITRLWTAFNPPHVEKRKDVIRFGVLGAAGIAPLTLIIPAKSHPEVFVQCIAARDRKRAEAFAKTHGIPEVKDSYQEILDDPTITAILIPLPNSHHHEWALRSLAAGKHVLLEKPCVSNHKEALSLFQHPILTPSPSNPTPPVLLEAFHNTFHPSLSLFLSYISREDIAHVDTASMIPWWLTSKADIHFRYELAGGSMMAMGVYSFSALRYVFGASPEECTRCETKSYTDGMHDKCDWQFEAEFTFPGDRKAVARSTLRGPTAWKPKVPDEGLGEGMTKVRSREVTLWGLVHAVVWHRVDVVDVFEVRGKDGRVVKTWTEKKSEKKYEVRDGEQWMSYRFQLEEFVNRIKGRETRWWVEGEDSVEHMRMVDMAYVKSGLGVRPSSGFHLE
ncbi:putative oxidoreductase [Sporormia fimetaria CBS 119925]|uniref:D-xylose 1-dehydrogenase (NADP(+), D-xylono-1,5-lactone-forming) n=1 Tax=Sporormia fimetaria CBS 119925 TaxID=1340428 RepID=A0A6A6UZZ0_9PLEO|nr:putative oxidoreductase [Sporormia fimetaria CBS 119925]